MSFSAKSIGIGVVIGLVIGLVLGYAVTPQGEDTTELEQQITQLNGQVDILQTEIDTLQTEITIKNAQLSTLQNQIEELEALVSWEKGKWNEIATFSGSSSLTTEYFPVVGTELRIGWAWNPDMPFSMFNLELYRAGADFYTWFGISLADEGYTYVHDVQPGTYYLDIQEANIGAWVVIVEVFVPE